MSFYYFYYFLFFLFFFIFYQAGISGVPALWNKLLPSFLMNVLLRSYGQTLFVTKTVGELLFDGYYDNFLFHYQFLMTMKVLRDDGNFAFFTTVKYFIPTLLLCLFISIGKCKIVLHSSHFWRMLRLDHRYDILAVPVGAVAPPHTLLRLVKLEWSGLANRTSEIYVLSLQSGKSFLTLTCSP